MAKLELKIISANGEILKAAEGIDEIYLVYNNEYQEGDSIQFTTDSIDTHYVIQIDDAVGEAFTYITNTVIDYSIPFGDKKRAYSPKAFFGDKHLLTARVACEHEIASYKNLAKNVMDQHGDPGCFPHATANVETRDESVFAAKNAINGVKSNDSHGSWPYESWGINRQDDAEITLEFGRKVNIDKIVLYNRADFPHDNWWINATFNFSDGSEMTVDLVKSGKAQVFNFPNKTVEWVKMGKLIKADDPSPFPALTQIEIYGVEA